MKHRLEFHVLCAVDKRVHTVHGNATNDKNAKETELQTHTHRHRDIETEKHTYRQTHRHIDRQIYTHRDTGIDSE